MPPLARQSPRWGRLLWQRWWWQPLLVLQLCACPLHPRLLAHPAVSVDGEFLRMCPALALVAVWLKAASVGVSGNTRCLDNCHVGVCGNCWGGWCAGCMDA